MRTKSLEGRLRDMEQEHSEEIVGLKNDVKAKQKECDLMQEELAHFKSLGIL